MGKHMKRLLIVLGVFVVLFGINQMQQRGRASSSDQVFDLQRDDVFSFDITKGEDSIALLYNGASWSILQHDTLVVKESTFHSVFDNVLNVKRTSLVSGNAAKWEKCNEGATS